MKHLQQIANDILELTPYRVYTPKEVNDFLREELSEEGEYDETEDMLILCIAFHTVDETETHLHPGFMIKQPSIIGNLEAISIIPPGPVYKAPDIDGIIECIMDYYNHLNELSNE